MLTPKQARFRDEYLIDLNARQAAIRAGYSEKTANQQGPRLLEAPHVKAAIDSALARRAEETNVDATYVLNRLVDEVEADLADLYDEAGNLRPISEWPRIWRQGLVQGVESEQLYEGHGKDRKWIGTARKIRLDSRIRRLELIGKHVRVNAFQEQVNHTGLEGLAEKAGPSHPTQSRSSTCLPSQVCPVDRTACAKRSGRSAGTAVPQPASSVCVGRLE